ncbi:TolC family protein [Flavobacteriaceae bacterium 14752]|uniref:TolC family protein n=1 Tax=Mesohalobacter salilacus TaxID=2491711 RepID=UPI000F633687|nr:TolC family protein [Flavobacteriaceae bacterium 14752]
MKNRLFILWICLMSFTFCKAQELLTKSEAVELTLQENFGIQIAKNNVDIAENNAGILNSGYLPSLSAVAGSNFSRQDRLAEINGQEPLDQKDLDSENYNASLNLNYTLFDGLGRKYNYKRLKEQYNLSELQARETIENTLIQLFSVYYEVARRYENVEVLKQTLSLSKDRLKRVEYLFDYGQVNKLQVLNAKVDVSNDSINLINETQTLENAKRDLKVVINSEFSNNFQVDTTVNFTPMLKIEKFVEEHELNNVSLLQVEKSLEISAYDQKISKTGYLPTLDLIGSYGWNRNISPETPFFSGSTQTSTTISAGLSLNWNLFDTGQTAVRIQNAKIDYDNQKLQKQQIQTQVDRDIQNALNNYKTRLYIYELQEQNVKTNRDNFKRTENQFQLGQITSVEFRQAQVNLQNAQTSYSLAKYDAKLAELQLLQLTGQLLNVNF